jgi:hypothetical protein
MKATFARFRVACGVHDQVEGNRRPKTNFRSCRRWCAKKVIEANGKVGCTARASVMPIRNKSG